MSDCTSCPVSRREFLVDIGMAVGALAVIGFATPLSAAGGVADYAIPSQDGALIDKANDLILVRWKNQAYGFSLSCPHQKTALRWNAKDAKFQCPKHKSKYEADGVFISGKATRGMDRHPIRRDGDKLVIDTTVKIKQSDNATAWNNAFVKL